MTLTAILEHLLKFCLLCLATAALRRLYLTTPLLANFRAYHETNAETTSSGPSWFFSTLFSCRECVTTWLAIFVAGGLWMLPAAFWPHWTARVPGWLILAVSGAYLVHWVAEQSAASREAPLKNRHLRDLEQLQAEKFEQVHRRLDAIHRELHPLESAVPPRTCTPIVPDLDAAQIVPQATPFATMASPQTPPFAQATQPVPFDYSDPAPTPGQF